MANENTEQPQEKKSSNTLLILIIVVMGIVIGVGGALAFIMIKSQSDPSAPSARVEKKDDRETAPDTMGPVIMLDPFIVNLSGAGLNYLKVDMALELSNTEVKNEITAKKPQIKDSIILLLSTKSFEDIRTGEGKIILKDELMMRLNNILRTGRVRNIYFTSFIVQ